MEIYPFMKPDSKDTAKVFMGRVVSFIIAMVSAVLDTYIDELDEGIFNLVMVRLALPSWSFGVFAAVLLGSAR